jgi:transcriptional regulator with XRE-family HTH domain
MPSTAVSEAINRWLDVSMSNAGMTGRDVAQYLNVHDSAVSRWRSGRGKPNMNQVAKLAELFKVEPLRLAVLAGLIDEKIAGVPPVEIPAPVRARQEVRDKIKSLPGLTKAEVEALIERYDELQSRGME